MCVLVVEVEIFESMLSFFIIQPLPLLWHQSHMILTTCRPFCVSCATTKCWEWSALGTRLPQDACTLPTQTSTLACGIVYPEPCTTVAIVPNSLSTPCSPLIQSTISSHVWSSSYHNCFLILSLCYHQYGYGLVVISLSYVFSPCSQSSPF